MGVKGKLRELSTVAAADRGRRDFPFQARFCEAPEPSEGHE